MLLPLRLDLQEMKVLNFVDFFVKSNMGCVAKNVKQ